MSILQLTEVNAEDVTLCVSIDLRSWQSSGPNNDGLRGNARANILVGNAGNDVISGGSGDDQLFGGSGDDYYLFKTASGNDMVDEEGSGGTEVLRIEGMHDYDSIEEDFTFRRIGNDLLVRLDLNGQRNNNGDQIRIRNMGDESSPKHWLC